MEMNIESLKRKREEIVSQSNYFADELTKVDSQIEKFRLITCKPMIDALARWKARIEKTSPYDYNTSLARYNPKLYYLFVWYGLGIHFRGVNENKKELEPTEPELLGKHVTYFILSGDIMDSLSGGNKSLIGPDGLTNCKINSYVDNIHQFDTMGLKTILDKMKNNMEIVTSFYKQKVDQKREERPFMVLPPPTYSIEYEDKK
jgi:hypothetical protein